jgi:hypothetical protein
VFLFNEVAPDRSCGGEVVLVDTREITQELDESVLNRFKRLGVRYYNHLNGNDTVFPSWQQVGILCRMGLLAELYLQSLLCENEQKNYKLMKITVRALPPLFLQWYSS